MRLYLKRPLLKSWCYETVLFLAKTTPLCFPSSAARNFILVAIISLPEYLCARTGITFSNVELSSGTRVTAEKEKSLMPWETIVFNGERGFYFDGSSS